MTAVLELDDVAVSYGKRRALQVASRGYVLETGRLVTSGTSAELSADPRVRTAYLGLTGPAATSPADAR